MKLGKHTDEILLSALREYSAAVLAFQRFNQS